jgi:hypothetical protein
MKKTICFIAILCLTVTADAGFKPKLIKSKKPEQFQARAVVSGVGFAADLLLEGKEQKKFFCEELSPHDVIAVRLAVFNNSAGAVVLPLEDIRLTDPEGREVPRIGAAAVAEAVNGGIEKNTDVDQPTIQTASNPARRSGPVNTSDPTYDPSRNPADPNYDPTCEPNSPCGQLRKLSQMPAPGAHVEINPYGSEYGTISERLIQKDFIDKSHSADPIPAAGVRDKFLFFALPGRPAGIKGYELHLPPGKDIPQPVILKF